MSVLRQFVLSPKSREEATMVLPQRLPEIDRNESGGGLTRWFQCGFLSNGILSLAISRKNPDGYCGLKGTGVVCAIGGNVQVPAH